MTDDEPQGARERVGFDPAVARWVVLAMLGLAIGGFVAFRLLSTPVPPPSPEVARDPFLMQGRAIFLSRCVPCHGLSGKGDGPLASRILGPPVGNLTDTEWKHGDQPEHVLKIIREGASDTRMQGWGTVLDPPELAAVAAFVHALADRPVPDVLRGK